METIDDITPDARTLELERPEGTAPVKLVLAVEGLDTSDGRFINVGALDTRPMPLTIWAQVRSTHGIEGDAATFVVGSITEAERVPGPEVVQRSTGEPFPPDTAVWLGRGWMYTDVPSPESGSKPAYTLMKDGALYGNSVDLVAVDAEFVYGENDPLDGPPRQIVTHSASIASTTLVGIPAFQDAFVEVDGEPITPSTEALALVAAGPAIPSWRSAEIGDKCGPCLAAPAEEHFTPEAAAHSVAVLREALADQGLAEPEPFADVLTGDDLEPAALDFSTSGMVALIPAEPGLLAVPAGDRPDDLHLTLAYLGEEVTSWRPEEIAAVHAVARSATDAEEQCRQATERALEANEEPPECDMLYVSPAQEGPLGLRVFAHALFNPNGDNGFDPAAVYLFDGSGHSSTVTALAEQISNELARQVGAAQFPEQHRPFIPHVTAGYNLDPNQLSYTGPVTFDRIRVAIGNQRTDYPLGGGSAIVAAAAPLPPAAWFDDPKLEGPTAATVTEDGRVFGHLATWGTCHVTFPGQCITPPRSPSGYAYFLVHSTRALGASGQVVEVPVGYGTLSRDSAGGHAAVTMSATEAARHYDNTCTAVYEINVGEDDHGIWFAGRLMPGLDEFTEHKARGVAFSGDWRPIRGRRELVAALGVNTPGFPVPRVRVVGGQPAALVAAGVPLAEPVSVPVPGGAVAQLAAWVAEQRDTAERERVEWAYALTSAELTLALEGDHPWFSATETAEVLESLGALLGEEYAGKKLHLPPFIKRIEKHLRAKGMSESHAIATAVNAAKKMCSTGDISFPGRQQINPGSRAEACRAVAQWKKDRPGAR